MTLSTKSQNYNSMITSSFFRLLFEQIPELSPPLRGLALFLELLLALLSYVGTDNVRSPQCSLSHNPHPTEAPAPPLDLQEIQRLSSTVSSITIQPSRLSTVGPHVVLEHHRVEQHPVGLVEERIPVRQPLPQEE
jgi:hypothetical protein